ncbi:MAG: winged helix-turn-helix transcriptional regulator [Oscillochloris sp.]|nr:winged helix-turn-helix transcriptional regulator [Oscillochloris sp.]
MESSLSKTMQALSDPTRRAILEMLNDGDKSAGELAAHFHISAPSVSHHLGVLRGAGLVLAQRNGQQIIYRLNVTVVHEMLQQLMGLFRVGAGRRDLLKQDEGA